MNKSGSLLGGTLLVAGCCIGAGMLGLPVITALTGFKPSLLMFFLSWIFMATTGLLLLEVNLSFPNEVNIVSMAERTLGKAGKFLAGGLFLFLFYSLLVAYIAGSGVLIVDFVKAIFNIDLSPALGSIICTIILGSILYFGTAVTDQFNRLLMAGLILSYFALVGAGLPHVKTQLLEYLDWTQAYTVLPVMIVSFGYHNLVPSLSDYLNRDVKKIKIAILVGSAIPLFVYLIWEYLILGLIPVEGAGGFREALDKGQMATQALKAAVGAPWVIEISQTFAFFAIVTSLLAVALSFVDFLADALSVKKTAVSKIWLCGLVLLLPLAFSIIYPNIFLKALQYAGGIGAVILFGILPALMVWIGRYCKKIESIPQIVPGGRLVLLAIILFSCFIVALQLI